MIRVKRQSRGEAISSCVFGGMALWFATGLMAPDRSPLSFWVVAFCCAMCAAAALRFHIVAVVEFVQVRRVARNLPHSPDHKQE